MSEVSSLLELGLLRNATPSILTLSISNLKLETGFDWSVAIVT